MDDITKLIEETNKKILSTITESGLHLAVCKTILQNIMLQIDLALSFPAPQGTPINGMEEKNE